jgi:hypothetical protein
MSDGARASQSGIKTLLGVFLAVGILCLSDH